MNWSFILISFNNANTESKKIQTFNELNMLLSNLEIVVKNI